MLTFLAMSMQNLDATTSYVLGSGRCCLGGTATFAAVHLLLVWFLLVDKDNDNGDDSLVPTILVVDNPPTTAPNKI